MQIRQVDYFRYNVDPKKKNEKQMSLVTISSTNCQRKTRLFDASFKCDHIFFLPVNSP